MDSFDPLTPEEMNTAQPSVIAANQNADTSLDYISEWPPELEYQILSGYPDWGVMSGSWDWRNAKGRVVLKTYRFDKPDGGKEFRPLTCWRNKETGKTSLHWKAPPAYARSLYGEDRLKARPKAPVLVVEGEKTAEQASKMFPDFVCVTSYGGANGAELSDWMSLEDRVVVVWPDYDSAGSNYAVAVREVMMNFGYTPPEIISVPKAFPKGWDLADEVPEGFTHTDVRDLLKFAHIDAAFLFAQKQAAHKQDLVLQEIREKYGLQKRVLNKRIKELQQNGPVRIKDQAWKIARETLRQHYGNGGEILHSKDGRFWAYDGKRWRRIDDETVKNSLLRVIKEWGVKGSVAGVITNALSILKSECIKPGDPLGLLSAPQPVINCKNGELWFDNGPPRFTPHRAENMLTNIVDTHYDPNAECPKFEQFISDIMMGDPDKIRHLQEVMGYIIHPDKSQAAFFLFKGIGSNGKSLLVSILQELLGEAFFSERVQELEKPFLAGELPGKLAYIDDDVDAADPLPVGQIKKFCESKTITGEIKFGPRFTFKLNMTLVMLANEFPFYKDTTQGWLRRAHVITFDQRFLSRRDAEELAREEVMTVEQCVDEGVFKLADSDLKEALVKEKSGILNWAINGYLRLKKRKGFDEPDDFSRARAEWAASANSLAEFLMDGTEKADGHVSLQELIRKYQVFCSDHRRTPFSDNKVSGQLRQLGYTVTGTNGRNQVRNIKITYESGQD